MVKPDPRAKPFVPPPSLAAKLYAKQGDGWGSDSGSVKSDASGASGGRAQASSMPACKPQGIQQDIVKSSVYLTLRWLHCPECGMWYVTSFLGTVWLISGREQVAIWIDWYFSRAADGSYGAHTQFCSASNLKSFTHCMCDTTQQAAPVTIVYTL